ncbi:hypothetical protein [Burkholderia multivorans]|uniref:hypothetical protein n=1 Tax=Burkholderia multivorans TaxID=87883 RepID=UPI00207CF953|nr:hypothetical protein [Burkholderia multivorans]MCO1451159.1 hypothetical protein [Burkholderia multivorans]
MKRERRAAAFEHAADPQIGRAMQKVEGRLQLHPEQQFRHRRPNRRLAGFVRPDDHMEILRRRPEKAMSRR